MTGVSLGSVKRVASCHDALRISSTSWSAVLEGCPALLVEPAAVCGAPEPGSHGALLADSHPPRAAVVLGFHGDMLLALACDDAEFFAEQALPDITLEDAAVQALFAQTPSIVPLDHNP